MGEIDGISIGARVRHAVTAEDEDGATPRVPSHLNEARPRRNARRAVRARVDW